MLRDSSDDSRCKRPPGNCGFLGVWVGDAAFKTLYEFDFNFMYIPKNLSKNCGPVAGIVVGLIIFASGLLLFYLILMGVKMGKVWKMSKHNPGFIIREDSPVQFWSLEAAYSFVLLVVIVLSISILIDAIRKLCAGHK
jgi:hypothetical protein